MVKEHYGQPQLMTHVSDVVKFRGEDTTSAGSFTTDVIGGNDASGADDNSPYAQGLDEAKVSSPILKQRRYPRRL